jgi:NAD(P)-dependent dehydrogenase (short-subunit alcohol dehydrogenase family)
MSEAKRPLAGRVVRVSGATRGAGHGIAARPGATDATVRVTGRATREQRSEMDRPETLEETAERGDAAGGRGIAARATTRSRATVTAAAGPRLFRWQVKSPPEHGVIRAALATPALPRP